MSHERLKPWRTEERQSGPYPERAERDPNLVDRALLAWGEISARSLGHRRRMLEKFCDRVDAAETDVQPLSDDGLKDAAQALRPLFLRHGLREDLLVRCFALAREGSRRVLGKRHYRVQLMGGRAMVEGWLAEMATGEGKTITAGPPAIAAALAGLPVHVVTVNDYLAERDAEIVTPLYALFGLSVGICRHGQKPEERRKAYEADITYGANKEIAFDYLRDRIALGHRRDRAGRAVRAVLQDRGMQPLLLRGLGFAIVDEADSVLVDEARTPLIISAEVEGDDEAATYALALEVASRLTEGQHYELLTARRLIRLTEAGKERVEQDTRLRGGLWGIRRAREELAEQALSALHLFLRGQQYVVADGKVQIVDEYTGRIADGRTWERGLHQLIEQKEGVELTGRRETLARITYQRFFRRYLRLSGMTGTGWELAGELRAVYGLSIARIPTNKKSRRKDLGAKLLGDMAAKWDAVAEAARRMSATGRPVLIGTKSVEASEQLAERLAALGLKHTVLNARFDKEEAEIVARAGERGRITVATNMAGRGTDIHLGEGVEDLGGLHVIVAEYHDSPRIDRQLIGRGARQGNPGSFEAIVCLEDELFRKFGGGRLGHLARAVPGGGIALLRRVAQWRAEAMNAATRRQTLRSDTETRKQLGFAGAPE
ncbi:preprotein translocase subunit SecA [Roseomonas sp. AR75]|uniref:preprotein translocase subunit SecA n=1 Tax=Roseomonas sp. AR75 TaxID=2562311 RepID=UPI0010C011E2|nr:preprotein translocase subunit SecA [Roseomonas sp. AR75]